MWTDRLLFLPSLVLVGCSPSTSDDQGLAPASGGTSASGGEGNAGGAGAGGTAGDGGAAGGATSNGQLVQGSNNPAIRHIQTADPAALAHGDRLYIYAGHDETPVGGGTFNLNNWHVFSTADMAHWTDHGVALSVADFGWAAWGAWAGHVTERNGKFYWYVPMSSSKGGPGFDIGVAIADSPTGPFVAQPTPVLTDNMTTASPGNGQPNFKDIDPAVFVDDDGQAYMYWGNIDPHIVKLAEDMVTIEGTIEYPKLFGFTEAPYMNKIDGIYFLTYASGWPEQIAYSTSPGPMGPWTWRGRLNDVTGSGTNHQSLVQFRGHWYFVYHNAGLYEGGEFRRSVCVDELHFNEDGLFEEVIQTTDGVAQLDPGPFELEQGYQLVNEGSGHVLDLASDSRTPGTKLVQHAPAEASVTQAWHLEAVGAAVYRIVNASSDLCAGVSGESLNNSAPIEQAACTTAPSQRWRAVLTSSGSWMFVNYASNRVLEIAAASPNAGAPVVQYPSIDGAHQHWNVVPR